MSDQDDASRPPRPAIPPFARPAGAPRGPLRPLEPGAARSPFPGAPVPPVRPATPEPPAAPAPPAAPSARGARPATPGRSLTADRAEDAAQDPSPAGDDAEDPSPTANHARESSPTGDHAPDPSPTGDHAPDPSPTGDREPVSPSAEDEPASTASVAAPRLASTPQHLDVPSRVPSPARSSTPVAVLGMTLLDAGETATESAGANAADPVNAPHAAGPSEATEGAAEAPAGFGLEALLKMQEPLEGEVLESGVRASLAATEASSDAPEPPEATPAVPGAFSWPPAPARTISEPATSGRRPAGGDDPPEIDLGLTDEDLALDDVIPAAEPPAAIDDPAEVILGEIEAEVAVEGAEESDQSDFGSDAADVIIGEIEAEVAAAGAGEPDQPDVGSDPGRATTVPRMATPLGTMRVPAIPAANLSVAAAIEAVARKLRAGEIVIPTVRPPESDEASLALALSAVLGNRH